MYNLSMARVHVLLCLFLWVHSDTSDYLPSFLNSHPCHPFPWFFIAHTVSVLHTSWFFPIPVHTRSCFSLLTRPFLVNSILCSKFELLFLARVLNTVFQGWQIALSNHSVYDVTRKMGWSVYIQNSLWLWVLCRMPLCMCHLLGSVAIKWQTSTNPPSCLKMFFCYLNFISSTAGCSPKYSLAHPFI